VPEGQEIAEGRKRLRSDQRRPNGEVSTFGTAHPTRQRADAAIRRLTDDAFAITMLLSPPNAKEYLKERMPPIVHGGGLQTVGTMQWCPSAST
jgi:hypothetical protein